MIGRRQKDTSIRRLRSSSPVIQRRGFRSDRVSPLYQISSDNMLMHM